MRRGMDKVELRATGFIEGENIIIEWRWAGGQYDRLSSPAGEPVGRDLAVLVTFDAPASFAAKAVIITAEQIREGEHTVQPPFS